MKKEPAMFQAKLLGRLMIRRPVHTAARVRVKQDAVMQQPIIGNKAEDTAGSKVAAGRF